ncbi:MAG TPA: sulfurtransferase TusA family protein [Symbiobacteriaceae bacterium]|jgi:rhodanese-related sulfurtransferase/TusA-related sulfurtransferase
MDGPTALTIDARGLSCPMPIIRARKGIDTIDVGAVMEVLVTDRGAPADFRNWCLQTDQKFLGQVPEEGYSRLLIKKVVTETKEKGRVFPHEISNADLAALITAGSAPVVIDVREEPEFRAGHIPGAVHVPIAEIEAAVADLDRNQAYAVICRSARRSDYACQIMDRLGFARVQNVVPGMSGWAGRIDK